MALSRPDSQQQQLSSRRPTEILRSSCSTRLAFGISPIAPHTVTHSADSTRNENNPENDSARCRSRVAADQGTCPRAVRTLWHTGPPQVRSSDRPAQPEKIHISRGLCNRRLCCRGCRQYNTTIIPDSANVRPASRPDSETVCSIPIRTQFGRYSFLTLGIAYGAYHQRRLSAKETKVREIEAKQKEVRDAKLAIERSHAAEGE